MMMMDTLGFMDRSLYALDGISAMEGMDSADNLSMLDVWDSDLESHCSDALRSGCDGDSLWSAVLDNTKMGMLVKNDRLLTDSLPMAGETPVKHEHSYSLETRGMASDGDSIPDSPLSLHDDMESECFPCIPMKNASGQHRLEDLNTIKEEPMSPEADDEPVLAAAATNINTINTIPYLNVKNEPGIITIKQEPGAFATKVTTTSQQSLLKPPAIVLSTRSPINGRLLYPKVSVKLEPEFSSSLLVNKARLIVSSCPSNTITTSSTTSLISHVHRQPINTPLISSQPKGASGIIFLTEEEKRTLITEGYPIPTKLPLSKTEERSLKKIRRKIKNKISAQESRRKKKEYMDALERKCDIINGEASGWRSKAEALETQNSCLLRQLAQLQAQLAAVTGTELQTPVQATIAATNLPQMAKIPPVTIQGRVDQYSERKQHTVSLANECLEIDVD